MEDLAVIRRRSLTSERRALPPVEKAELAVRVDGATYRGAVVALRVSTGSLARAINAVKDGRPIGRRGRPPLTTIEEDSEIVFRVMEEGDHRRPPTYEKTIEIVSHSVNALYSSLMITNLLLRLEKSSLIDFVTTDPNQRIKPPCCPNLEETSSMGL